MATRRSVSWASSWRMNLSTIVSMTSGVSPLNVTMASRRLRNSGLKSFSRALLPRRPASCARSELKPMMPALISREPALEVMIRMT